MKRRPHQYQITFNVCGRNNEDRLMQYSGTARTVNKIMTYTQLHKVIEPILIANGYNSIDYYIEFINVIKF